MKKECEGCGSEFDALSPGKMYCKECTKTRNYVVSTNDARTRYSRVMNSAKARGIEFDLHYEEFASFYGMTCTYCGDKTESVNLDRIDSNKGYFIGNVVPCCTDCNCMKGTKSVDEFITQIKKIANNF